MAYNFKNLADVELLSAMPEEANVVVEVNGTTKRAPQVKVESAGGSGRAFVVNITFDENNGFTADKTFEEVESAIREGSLVFARMYADDGDGKEYATQFSMTEYSGELGYAFFTDTHNLGGAFVMNQLGLRRDGTISNSSNRMKWNTTT